MSKILSFNNPDEAIEFAEDFLKEYIENVWIHKDCQSDRYHFGVKVGDRPDGSNWQCLKF